MENPEDSPVETSPEKSSPAKISPEKSQAAVKSALDESMFSNERKDVTISLNSEISNEDAILYLESIPDNFVEQVA